MKLFYEDIDRPGLNTREVYEKAGGYKMLRKALEMDPDDVLAELQSSGVRGRGGAGFAMGKKASFLPHGTMDKYLVCNADESEPGTFKDRELMQKNPHLLIEGMIIAAWAAGINRSFIYIRGEYEHQADILEAALEEARAAGYLGERILRSDHTLDMVLHRGAGAYICGEETALLDSLEGKRGNPRLKPPFPALQGLYKGPTLINNVETLMNVPHILRMGGEEFAKIGSETSTGTKVVSVSGCVRRPGNYEVTLGTPSREIIMDLAGGPEEGRSVKAWFPGGSSAPVLPGTDEMLDLPYDFDSLAKAGSMLGSGAIIVIDDSIPIIDVAYKTAKFYAHESCGKCSPCREGTNWTVKMLERIENGDATPMDLDIMASVQEQIIGNCLCVLGDAMAMPIGSMIKHFREEFEAHIEMRREQNGLGAAIPQVNRGRNAGPGPMRDPAGVDPTAAVVLVPRPESRDVTFSIDGREVTAPENAMLVDAAKYGDVEIPVFCYEPKLGQPVGACRMCLVEIEGIPKLQTACSTPVKDGMVVHTQTDRVHDAQRAVVEFLLINHPLDCPVCDKGGECPLQDVTYGWGPGTSRYIEPKRHFKKPLELSPLVAIDRERCILCYRCVRFSQEISEDYQLILLERGAHSYVGTFDGHPYVAPFSGNIVELCPVGALTSSAYRFRARPWDIEGAGSVCTLCPAQCNVEFTVRDDRVMRVLARDNADVDDGWLCDKGRYAYQHVHVDERITQPLVREGEQLMTASWEKALAAAGAALAKAGGRAAALAGGETSNEEAFLLAQLFRDGLGSGHLASRPGGELPLDVERALADPALQATVPDLEFAHTVVLIESDPVDDAPILDLRIRKGVRRNGVRVAVASARPTALDARADAVLRTAPGGAGALLVSLDAALGEDAGNHGGAASAAGTNAQAVADFVATLTAAGEDIVIVYGERMLAGPRGEIAAKALLNLAARLGLAGRPGAGLLEIPASANGRGLREAGFAPGHGAGFATLAEPGHGADAIARGLADAELSTLYLLHADPLRSHPDRALWQAALGAAQTVIAHESVLTETVREYADVVFPAEAYAEKEGTLTHPDGRLQRLRTAIGRPQPAGPGSGVRPGWQVIADVAQRAGHGLGVAAGPIASRRLFEAVPFYAGLTLDEIGGRGVRWQEREAAASFEVPAWEPVKLKVPRAARAAKGSLRLGTYRSLWSSKEVDVSPALRFLRPQQVVELSPVDAGKLGLADGDRVEVGSPVLAGEAGRGNGTRVRGAVRLRAAVPKGSVFLADGTPEEAANLLTEALVEIQRIGGPEAGASAVAAQLDPAADLAEAPPSAPLEIPPTGPSQSGHGA